MSFPQQLRWYPKKFFQKAEKLMSFLGLRCCGKGVERGFAKNIIFGSESEPRNDPGKELAPFRSLERKTTRFSAVWHYF